MVRTKPEIALAEIDRVIAAGARFGCIAADAGYGLSALFRLGPAARRLVWAVGNPRHLKVYPVVVRLIWPRAVRRRPRQRYIPDVLSIPAEKMFGKTKYENEIANFGRFKAQKPAISKCPIHPKLYPQSMAYAVILSFGSLNKSGANIFIFSPLTAEVADIYAQYWKTPRNKAKSFPDKSAKRPKNASCD
jgi:DDE superfamily endonuclease